ncbi:phosphatidylserine decarboxylase [Pseudomonadota bacterium]
MSAGFGTMILLRFSVATDHLYHALVKDPERQVPAGDVLVAPADGTVLYIRRVSDGVIPYVVKKGVEVPVRDHLKSGDESVFKNGYLIGIYMNTQGVHINRVPDNGTLESRTIFNGPHMDMTEAETRIILSQLVPGWVTVKKLLGLNPFGIEDHADYILKSARETLRFRDSRGRDLYIVRIADYYVGKILTWIRVGEAVERGQKLGMISWGSQTDMLFENSPGMSIAVEVGDYVYGGETVLARY